MTPFFAPKYDNSFQKYVMIAQFQLDYFRIHSALCMKRRKIYNGRLQNYCHLILFSQSQFRVECIVFRICSTISHFYFSKDLLPRHKNLQSRAVSINWKEF